MRPLSNFGLKRRMHEIERALLITIVIFIVMLVIISAAELNKSFQSFSFIDRPEFREGYGAAFAGKSVESARVSSQSNNAGMINLEHGQQETITIPSQREIRTEETNVMNAPKSEGGVEFSDGRYFLPGSITGMDRTELLHSCYVPPDKHLPPGQGCSVSEKYKIIFHLTPKSGSSTGRHVIKNDFEGEDHMSDLKCRPPAGADPADWMQVAVLRNPATRAFASYEEMFVRRIGMPEHIPESARRFMEPFRGWIYKNYSALFDTVEGVAKLNEAYEQFMQDWDGWAFDMHLESQVAYNVRRSKDSASQGGRPDSSHLTFVFDTHTMEESFFKLADMVQLKKRPKVIKGRAYPRRLNVTNVSNKSYQAMCRRYKDDFCCLNYKLPPACAGSDAPKGGRVRCEWVEEYGKKWIKPVVV